MVLESLPSRLAGTQAQGTIGCLGSISGPCGWMDGWSFLSCLPKAVGFIRPFGCLAGTLNLKVKQVGEAEELLWTGTGSHGAVWHRGFSSIPVRPDQNYQVRTLALSTSWSGTNSSLISVPVHAPNHQLKALGWTVM